MRRIEIAFSADDQALLVEGEAVAAHSWSYADGKVRLHEEDGTVVASGVGGPFSHAALPWLSEIKVFAVSDVGVRQAKTLPVRSCAPDTPE